MAEFDRYAAGQFSWVDLMASDAEAAARFYGDLFGWTAAPNPNDEGGLYLMFRLGDVDVAGLAEMPDEMKRAGAPPHWSSYVTVADADDALARVEELGGRVEMPVMEIRAGGQRVGRMAIFTDPAGARLSIWEPGSHAGSGLANVPGTFSWNELCTRDVTPRWSSTRRSSAGRSARGMPRTATGRSPSATA